MTDPLPSSDSQNGSSRSRWHGRLQKAHSFQRASLAEMRQIALGAPEDLRSWFHELELFDLSQMIRKGYQSTFFREEGVWRSPIGYFRLWEDKSREQGLLFAHSYDEIETIQKQRPSFTATGGIQHVLKHDDGTALPEKEIYPVKFWKRRAIPKSADVFQAINQYSSLLAKAIMQHVVLFESDYEKGVFRSGACAYVFEFEPPAEGEKQKPVEQRKVVGIRYYSKTLNEGLVNPFGATAPSRLGNKVLPGVDLLAGTEGLSYADAFQHMTAHFHETVLRYVRKDDLISDEERKKNRAHYALKSASILFVSAFVKGKYFLKNMTLESASAGRNVFTNLALAVGKAFTGNLPAAGVALMAAGMAAVGLIKYKVNQDVLIDPKDPLANKYSEPRRRIFDFSMLQRRFRNGAFKSVTMLTKSTFDSAPPLGIKSEESLKNFPEDLIQTSAGLRSGSIVRFYSEQVVDRPLPAQFVRNVTNARKDGIFAASFLHEDIAWQFDTGQSFDQKTPRPPQAILDFYKKGHVLQIDNRAEASQRLSYIPLADAEAFFQDKFGRPMLPPGMAAPKPDATALTTEERKQSQDTLLALRQEFQKTARQVFAPDDDIYLPTDSKEIARAKKLIEKVVRKHDVANSHSQGALRPFVEKMVGALTLLEEKGVKYDLFVVGEKADRSIQLSFDLPDAANVTVMTKNRPDKLPLQNGKTENVYVMDFFIEGRAGKMASSAAIIDYIQDKLEDIAPLPSKFQKALNRLGIQTHRL